MSGSEDDGLSTPSDLHRQDFDLVLPTIELASPFLNAVRAAPDLATLTTPYRKPWSLDNAVGYIQQARHEHSNGRAHRQFVVAPDGRVLGLAELYDIRWEDSLALIGITIFRPGDRGRGLGKQILAALEDCAAARSITKLQARVIVSNIPSLRLFKGKDYRIEGRFLRHYKIGGKYVDVVVFAKVNR